MVYSYEDMASVQSHGQTEHFKELNETLKKETLVTEPLQVIFTKDAGGFASKL